MKSKLNKNYASCGMCQKSMVGWCNKHMEEEVAGYMPSQREYFAGLAMQGSICANDHASPDWITMEIANAHAKKAVMIADALIAELNKDQK